VHRLIGRGYTDVVDADLSKYFDLIPHSELMSFCSVGRATSPMGRTGRHSGVIDYYGRGKRLAPPWMLSRKLQPCGTLSRQSRPAGWHRLLRSGALRVARRNRVVVRRGLLGAWPRDVGFVLVLALAAPSADHMGGLAQE
jgi:hypothetical protein